MARKPKIIVMGRMRARPVRPPSKSDPRWWWRAEVYEEDSSRTVWTGRATAAEVEAHLLDARKGERRRQDDAEVKTVGRLLDGWWTTAISERGDLAPATRAGYRAHAKRLQAELADVLLSRVEQATLAAYRDRRLRSGAATSTVDLDLTVFDMAWRWARSIGLVQHEVPRPELRVVLKRQKHTPSAGEVATVIASMREHVAVAWPADAVHLMWATGMRIGEAAALRQGSVMRGPNGRPVALLVIGKTGARRVPVRKAAADLVARYTSTDGADLDAPFWPVTVEVFRHRLQAYIGEACERSQLPRWTSHGLRRSVVDRCARSKMDAATVAKMMGHSVQVMMAQYRQVTDDDVDAVADLAHLSDLPEGKLLRLEPRTANPHSTEN